MECQKKKKLQKLDKYNNYVQVTLWIEQYNEMQSIQYNKNNKDNICCTLKCYLMKWIQLNIQIIYEYNIISIWQLK